MTSGKSNQAKAIRQKQSGKSNDILEWLIAWEIILFSGQSSDASGLRFIPAKVMAVIFFTTSFLLFMKRYKNKFDFSAMSAVVLFSWACVSRLIFNVIGGEAQTGTVGINSVLLLNVASSYMAISSLSFRTFREKLLKALTILSAATLVAWALHVNLGIGSFGGHPAPTFYIFMDWGGRMASIYWEPGEYQIIMIFVLGLFFDEFKKFSFSEIAYYVKKFGIVILAIIVCQSTMGYLSLMALTGISFMFNASVKKNKIMYVILFAVAAFLALLIWRSDVVQEKLDSRNLQQRSSLYIRLGDNIALLNMSAVSPLTGLSAQEFKKYGRIYGDVTGSNGWFYMAALFGWPFAIFFMYCIVRNLRYMKTGIPSMLMFIPLFMSQSNEAWVFFPITFIYVYKYRDYL